VDAELAASRDFVEASALEVWVRHQAVDAGHALRKAMTGSELKSGRPRAQSRCSPPAQSGAEVTSVVDVEVRIGSPRFGESSRRSDAPRHPAEAVENDVKRVAWR
jgi:hypothetical protein